MWNPLTLPIFATEGLQRVMKSRQRWFWLGVVAIWLIALTLRFWGLERFNTLVFDEVYIAKLAHNYVTQSPFSHNHPPLGKYMVALGIWLKGFNTWGYRWMNALIGSTVPLILTGIAYQLTQRRSYALLAGGLATIDGLLLVESRYALLNIYLVFFGLLGHWLFLIAFAQHQHRRLGWLTGAAICFGAAVAVKWSGLGFLLGAYVFCCGTWFVRQLCGEMPSSTDLAKQSPSPTFTPFPRWQLWGYLPAIAFLAYVIAWLPHLQLDPTYNFWQAQLHILGYHGGIGSGPDEHPYCSSWYTWPLMLRSISYLYDRAVDLAEPLPIFGPMVPLRSSNFLYSVYALGNPMLWWFSTMAIAWMGWQWVRNGWRSVVGRLQSPTLGTACQAHPELIWIPLYLGTNYAANLLPWSLVSRCTFLYHYLPASMFSGLALAWLIDLWIHSSHRIFRVISLTVILLCLMSFIYWSPFFLGLPISPEEWKARIWLSSWI